MPSAPKVSNRAARRRREKLAHKRGNATPQVKLAECRRQHEVGQLELADAGYRSIIEAQPSNSQAHHLLGVLLLQTGRTEEALPNLAQAVRLSPQDASMLNNLGEGHRLLGDLEAAESAYRRALQLQPKSAGTLNNLALTLKAAGQWDDAERALRESLRVDAHDLQAQLNLADLLSSREQFEAALEHYDAALKRAPNASPAHYGRAYALYVLGQTGQAQAAAEAALRLNPGDDNTTELLAKIHVAAGSFEAASDAFLVTVKRRYRKTLVPRNAAERRLLYRTNRVKLRHDLEQLRYIINSGDCPPELDKLAIAFEDALSATEERSATEHFDVDTLGLTLVTQNHNRLLREWYPAVRPAGALNPALDTAAIEEQFLDDDPGLLFFDDYLHPQALQDLQRFALLGSCWFMTDHGAEVGATLSTGFCCPLLMQIAGETRERLPRLLGRHYFNTLWGLKFYRREPGVGRHIDDASMSINFWLTPDAGNSNEASGGLLYWNKEITEPGFFDHPTQEKFRRMDLRLAEPDTKQLKVAYRCNRAMLFRSTVIHGTDRVDFEDSYEQRRVNITCLYGRSQSSSVQRNEAGDCAGPKRNP